MGTALQPSHRDDAPRARIWRADDLDAELLRGRFVDYAYDPHAHETVCLALITGGAIRVRARGIEDVATRGDVVAINAEETHEGWAVDRAGWAMRSLHVRPAAIVALGDERQARCLHGPIIRDARLASLLFGVHVCSERAGPALKRQERYHRFVARLLARHGTAAVARAPGVEALAVRRARDFLDHRLDQRVSLDEVAAAGGVPPFVLLRAFVRATGMSPHAYQRQARVRVASALIRLGQPLAAVAAAAGFADQAHLTRVFRRVVGVTPGVYAGAFR